MKNISLHIEPSKLEGTLKIPSSKSQTLRAILLASLAKGESRIEQALKSPDRDAMIAACLALGAQIEEKDNKLLIQGVAGKVRGKECVIEAGNSGLVLRFVSAVAALGSESVKITGDASLCNRPMGDLLQGLSQLGAEAFSLRDNGCAPVQIKGPLKPGRVVLQGEDSQPVSALLMAAACSQGKWEIIVETPGERPFVDLTLEWLDRLNVTYSRDNYSRYLVEGKGAPEAFAYCVPGDLSSLAFPVGAALVTGSELTLQNVDLSDRQGDKKLLTIFQQMGATFTIEAGHRLKIGGGATLKGVNVDLNDCVDALLILTVVACYAKGETVICNIAVARQKECDRLACVTKELRKMGARIKELPDGLVISGSSLFGAEVFSHRDHRLAMALAVAGMGAVGKTVVSDCACIAKTYPNFVQDFKTCAVKMYCYNNC